MSSEDREGNQNGTISHHELDRCIQKHMKPIYYQLETLNKLLTGNGEPEKGIVVKVDRLEQERKNDQRRITRWLWIASIAIPALATVGSIAVRFFITSG